MNDTTDSSRLADMVTSLVGAARRAGADAADAVALRARSTSVSVRLGKVEGTESAENDDIALRVFVGKRTASVSANAGSDPAALAERAVAMARVSPEDPFQGLVDPSCWSRHPATSISSTQLRSARNGCARTRLHWKRPRLALQGTTNSGGAAASAGMGGLVLATSEGFVGSYSRTRFSRSVSVIAGEGTSMERDYEYSMRLHFADLERAGIHWQDGRRACGAPFERAQGPHWPGHRCV
jgi:PmbA protein